MHSQQDLVNCAARISEEGRLLLILGRSLTRAVENPDGLSSWAIQRLRELHELETKALSLTPRTLAQKPASRTPAAVVEAGSPVLAWIAGCSRQQEWTSVAIGVDIDGNKQVLAVLTGSTSEPLVCRNLVETLGDSIRLVITDGSLTLDDTIRLQWDAPPLVAHCRSAVRRSVVAHLLGEKRRWAAEQLQRIWSQDGPQAEAALKTVLANLRKGHPGAAERLERSLSATVVVDRLEVKSPLREHLVLAGVPRMAFAGAIKWGGVEPEAMKAGLATWLRRTRRLPGYRALPGLVERIDGVKLQEKEQAASHALVSKDAAHTTNG